MRHLEHDEQVKFFQMLGMLDTEEAFLTFAVPNGARFISKRHASRICDEGMKRGVPDILCASPCGVYAGLAIEMKIPPNKSTPAQKQWQAMLAKHNWRVEVCESAEYAFIIWANYTKLDLKSYELVARNFMFSSYVIGGA